MQLLTRLPNKRVETNRGPASALKSGDEFERLQSLREHTFGGGRSPLSLEARRKRAVLELAHPNAAGIDIGSASHFIAVPADRDDRPVREFKSFTEDLIGAADWLVACGVDIVAMKSTGVYCVKQRRRRYATGEAAALPMRGIDPQRVHVANRARGMTDAVGIHVAHERLVDRVDLVQTPSDFGHSLVSDASIGAGGGYAHGCSVGQGPPRWQIPSACHLR